MIETTGALYPEAVNASDDASHGHFREPEQGMFLVSLAAYWSHKKGNIPGSYFSLHVKQNPAFSKPRGQKLNDCEISRFGEKKAANGRHLWTDGKMEHLGTF